MFLLPKRFRFREIKQPSLLWDKIFVELEMVHQKSWKICVAGMYLKMSQDYWILFEILIIKFPIT